MSATIEATSWATAVRLQQAAQAQGYRATITVGGGRITVNVLDAPARPGWAPR
jgi:hypothetical protein